MTKQLELGRYAWHSLSLSIASIGAYYLPSVLAWGAVLASIVGIIFFETFFKKKTKIQKLLREEEVSNRTMAVDFVIGMVFVYWLTPQWTSAILLVCAWCDPSARVVGKYMQGRKISGTDKSWWGSLTCFILAVCILSFFFSLKIACITAIVVTIAEAFDPHGLTQKWWWLQDNGRIQVVASLVLFIFI